MAQLEHRVEQIEEFIRLLREGRADIAATTNLHQGTNSDKQHEPSTSTIYDHQSSPAKLSSWAATPNENEVDEADNSEDFMDGMAAVKFQDEQDSSFFGNILL